MDGAILADSATHACAQKSLNHFSGKKSLTHYTRCWDIAGPLHPSFNDGSYNLFDGDTC